MSETLEARAEVLKLARLLRREPATLSFLEGLAAADIAEFREQVTELLFSSHDAVFARLAAASRLLPVALVAALGQRAFGPVLSARIVSRLDPGRAVDVAERLPLAFLGDVAVELDPRRASELIARMPASQIAEITLELVRRREFVTMGRFVAHLSPEALSLTTEAIDEESLLRIAFVLESKATLSQLVSLLPPERLDRIMDAAAAGELWGEALDLLTHLTPEQAGTLADRAAARDDHALQDLVRSAQEHDLWEAVLPATLGMSASSLRRFATLPAVQDREVLEQIVRAAAGQRWGRDLLPAMPMLPEPSRELVTRALSASGGDQGM